MLLNSAVLFNLPRIPDDRGNLSFFQYPDQVPFQISKVAWINDIPAGTEMPGQANTTHKEIIIALSGSFDVIVNDGNREIKFTLNHPGTYLYIPEMNWRSLVNFSTNSVVFIVTDCADSGAECITEFTDFKSKKNAATL